MSLLQVSAINVKHLDPLKTWLDSCDIKFYEGTANLNWAQIMKHINEIGLEGFYDDGGWKFLDMGDDSGNEDEEDPEDAEPDFEPSESESSEEVSKISGLHHAMCTACILCSSTH